MKKHFTYFALLLFLAATTQMGHAQDILISSNGADGDKAIFVGTVASVLLVVFAAITNLLYRKIQILQENEAYIKLELASIDLFKFEVKNKEEIWRLYDSKFDIEKANEKDKWEIKNHVTQLLNLFELSIELHGKGIFDHKILSTWLAWVFETAKFKTFQHLWKENLKYHYTDSLNKLIKLSIESEDDFDKFNKLICREKVLPLCENKWCGIKKRVCIKKICRLARILQCSNKSVEC